MAAQQQPPKPSLIDAAAFLDEDVVAAYEHRPPYPDDVIGRLAALAAPAPAAVLELGCGTGELSRRLAPHATHVDAVDPSEAMLRVAGGAPGGDAANLTWTRSTAEEFDYPRRYSLAVAAESFHWMDAGIVMPALRRALAPGGHVVILTRGEEAPWADAFHEIIVEYSQAVGWRPYHLFDELRAARLWELDERITTEPRAFRQRVDDYVELQHSRAAFARYRMGAARAAEFDAALRRLLGPYAEDGCVVYGTTVLLGIGRPV